MPSPFFHGGDRVTLRREGVFGAVGGSGVPSSVCSLFPVLLGVAAPCDSSGQKWEPGTPTMDDGGAAATPGRRSPKEECSQVHLLRMLF